MRGVQGLIKFGSLFGVSTICEKAELYNLSYK